MLRNTSFRTIRNSVLSLTIAFCILLVAAPVVAQNEGDAFVFYVPLPESEVSTAMATLEAGSPTGCNVGADSDANPVTTVISIAIGSSGTVIYYDHHEDGYEPVLANPIQGETEIWGDNDPGNGIPPGFAADVLNPGDVITLKNNIDVTVPSNPAAPLYDGRDKLGSNRPVAVTRVAWDAVVGVVIAGAVELYDTSDFNTHFNLPIGENLEGIPEFPAEEMFERSWVSVMASQDDTIVTLNGGSAQTLDQGETYLYQADADDEIVATKRVQAHLVAGDVAPSGCLEMRWFTLWPTATWGTDYYSPVGTSGMGDSVAIWVYNPNGTEIEVNIESDGVPGADLFEMVDPGETVRMDLPLAGYPVLDPLNDFDAASGLAALIGRSGSVYTPDPLAFNAVATVNAASGVDSPDNDTWDWGFSMIPVDRLTSQAVIGWGPGERDAPYNQNGSPVWVMAVPKPGSNVVASVTVTADADGNLATTSDQLSFDLAPYESAKIYDIDNDQTGMRVFIDDVDDSEYALAVAWGEDADEAGIGNPFLDVGTTVDPFPEFTIRKDVEFVDYDQNGRVSNGDRIDYTIVVISEREGTVSEIIVTDVLPEVVSYVAGSTSVTLPDGNTSGLTDDDTSNGYATLFPLDVVDGFNDDGVLLGNLNVWQSGYEISFSVEIIDVEDLIPDPLKITNIACADPSNSDMKCDDAETLLPVGRLEIVKTVLKEGEGNCPGHPIDDDIKAGYTGDPVTYCFEVTNTGNTYLYPVLLNDEELSILNLNLAAEEGGDVPLAPGASLVYSFPSSIDGNLVNTAVASATAVTENGDEIPDAPVDPVQDTAEVDDLYVITGNIVIEKSTNGFDADDPDNDPVPTVRVGETVTWTYTVTNLSDSLLTIAVTDDILGPICEIENVEPYGGEITCTAEGIAAVGLYANVGTALGYIPDAPNGGGETTATDPSHYFGINPSILLEKTGSWNDDGEIDGVAEVGETISYTFVITNSGDVPLTQVQVIDPIVSVSGEAFILPVGGIDDTSYTGTYVLTQADIDLGFKYNIAEVTGLDPLGGTVSSTNDHTEPLPQAPAIFVDKTIVWTADLDEDGTLNENDEVTYVYTVVNPADGVFDPASVVDPGRAFHDNDPVIECSPPELNLEGQQSSCGATYVVTVNDLAGAMPQNMNDADMDGEPSTDDVITYLFEIDNTGNLTLDPLTLTDPLVGLADATCGVDILVPGDPPTTCSANYTLTQLDVDSGMRSNTAIAKGLPPDGEPGDEVEDDDTEQLVIPQFPLLDLDKSYTSNADEDQSGTVSLNDTLTYTFVATNMGNQTLTNVTIEDPLPGLSGLSCTPVQPSTLAPDEDMTCTATYVVTQADVDAGVIENVATADSNETEPVEDPEDVPIPQNPALGLDKSYTSNADEDQSGTVSLNDTLTYTFVASNDGDQTLTNVTIEDPLPGLSGLSCTPVQPSTLAPDEDMTCTATYVVTQADVDAGVIENVATADSNETEPVEDPEDVPIPQNPALGLDKSYTSNADEDQSGTVSLNDTLTYTFVASNDGDQTLTNVTIEDPLPGLSGLSCTPVQPSTLAPDEDMTCTATYVVTQADVDAGVIENVATADSNETEPVEDPEDVPIPQNPALGLDKSYTSNADEDQSGTVSLNDTLTYTFVASNDGDQTLTNVTIEDPLPGLSGLSCTPVQPSTLAPDEDMTCTATYVVTQADVDAGVIENVATADSNETEPVEDPEDVPIPQNPALGLDKSYTSNADEDQSGTVSLNDTLTYTFVASNDGDQTLTNVTIEDPLPGLSGLSCTPVQPSTLAPDEDMTCTATYVVTQADVDAGVIENVATADSNETEPVEDPEDVPIPQNPALGLDKSYTSNADEDQSGTVSLNDTLTYTFVASNDGDQTLTNVTIEDPLPGLSGLSCTPVQPSTLAPDEDMTCTATYVVTQADVDSGVIENVATADSNETEPVEDPEDVPIPQNGLIELLKTGTLDLGGDGIANPGDVITYSFTVTNTGNMTLTNITLADTVGGVTISGGPIASLAPGGVDSTTFTGSYAITQTDIDAGQFYNVATVTGTEPDGETVSDDDDHTEPIAARGAIELLKTGTLDLGGDGIANPGDVITYSFTVTNTGNMTLTNITLADTVGGVTISGGPIASLAPGGVDSTTFTGSYAITQTDIDAGQFYNVATVTGTEPDGETVSDDDDHTEPIAASGAIELLKTGTLDLGGDGIANPGDVITYSFTVTNTGNMTLTNITLADTVGGVTISGGPIASLAPGGVDSTTFTGSYAITQTDIDAGQFYNVATVTGTEPDGETVSDDDDHTEPIAARGAIELLKTGTLDLGGDGIANPGDVITYSFTVTNTGNMTLTNITLADTVGGVTISGGPIASLAPGGVDSTTFTGSYAITQTDIDAGQFYNVATVTGTEPDGETVSDDDDHTEPIAASGAIELLKTGTLDLGGDGIANPGDVITYSFTVTNTGNMTLTNITLADTVGGVTISGGPIASLAPGGVDSTTFTGSYAITQTDIDAGQFYNVATVTGTEPDGETVSDDDDHTEPIAARGAIELLKTGTLDLGGDGIANPGDVITYSFTVTNTGNMTLTNITLADTVGGVTISGGPIASLAPGGVDSTTFTGSYAITQTDIDAGQFYNVATVTGTEPDGETVSDDDDHTEPISRLPGVEIEKATNGFDSDTSPGELIDVGTPITWTYVVTNNGNVTLTNVTVTDDQGVAVDCGDGTNVIAVLLPGASETCTGNGVAEVGEYENLGTATGNPPVGPEVRDTDPSHYTGRQIVLGARIEITKTVNGSDIPEGASFTFQVRDPDGVVIDNPAYSVVIDSTTPMPAEVGPVSPGLYSLCEVDVIPGWNTTLTGMPGAFFPDGEPETVCVPLTVELGVELIEFAVDNDDDRNGTLTIGYWKNHCEPKKNRKDKLYIDQLLFDTGAIIDLGDGFVITWVGDTLEDGQIVVNDGGKYYEGCEPLIRILDKSEIEKGKEHASDPAFNMAAQLLAAELNYLNDATMCVGVTDAINDGRETLSQVGFDGTFSLAGYMPALEAAGLVDIARDLGEVLDDYNNGMTEPCSYEPFEDFLGLLFEKATNGWDADVQWAGFVPTIDVGAPVIWTYEVTNNTDAEITEILVEDDQDGVVPICPSDTLAAGESMVCTAEGTAVAGAYTNVGVVTAQQDGEDVGNTDRSNYLGIEP